MNAPVVGAPVVIVGAGQAAAQAVASLRAEGYAGDIAIFGDETHLPYQRPPLSKAFLADELTEDRLEIRPAQFYADTGVRLHLGARVARILPQEHAVALEGGTRQPYAKLLLATGTRARPLPVPGADLEGVYTLRGIDDVKRFRPHCVPGARLVIIGGGYIGLEVAAKTRKLGLHVTLVEGLPRLLARVACPQISDFVFGLHERHGVRIVTGAGVKRLLGGTAVTGVELSDGQICPADTVLAAVGALPNVELAAEAGLSIDNGVKVDEAARTSHADIYAVGDVASFPSALYGRRVRLESVQNAIDQAKAAAKAMMGGAVVYDPAPWFWSDQYDVKMQIAGLLDGFDRSSCEGDVAAGRFSMSYFVEDRLIAVCSINDPRGHMLGRRALAAPTTLATAV